MAAYTRKAPRVGTAIKADQSYLIQSQLDERRQEQVGTLPKLAGGLTDRNSQILARDHAFVLHIGRIEDSLRSKAGEKLEDKDYYKAAINKGMELLESNKDRKHGELGKVPNSFLPRNLKDSDKLLEQVWKSDKYSLKAKEEHTVIAAKFGQKQFTQQTKAGYEEQIRTLEAKRKDLGNKLYGRGIRPVLQSAAQGIETLIAPARLVAQGEQVGMAYQEAAQLAAYVDPTNAFSKYTHMIAANAAPMGAALAASAVPGIGMVLSGAVMGLPAGTDTLYELRRRGVPKDTAYTVAGFTALGTAATEMYLAQAFSKLPGGSKLFPDHGSRASRIKKIIGPLGSKTKLKDVVKAQTAGKITAKELAEVIGNALADTSRLGLIKDIGQAATTEAFTGGVEEWLQQGMQMAFTELALRHEDLEGILPRNEDGSYDVATILGEMNEAFKAGMILEGFYGAGGLAMGAKGRWNTAKTIEGTKNYIRSAAGQMLTNTKQRETTSFGGLTEEQSIELQNSLKGELDDYVVGNVNALSEESLDFIARRMLIQTMGSKKTGEAFQTESRKAMEDSINSLLKDPVQAFLIDNGKNVSIKEVVPGKAYTMSDGRGGTLVIAKANVPLLNRQGQEVSARYHSGVDGGSIEVSPDLWATLESKGLGKDVILLNHYQGSTMPHELSHAIIQNSPSDVGEAVTNMYDNSVQQSPEEIDMWQDRDKERAEEGATTWDEYDWRMKQADVRAGEAEQGRINKLEAPSEAVEQRNIQKGGKIGDIYAKLDVALRGKSASESSKKRHYENQVIQSARTGSNVMTDHLGVAAPTDVGPRIRRIGQKTADTAQSGYQAVRSGDVGAKASSAGGRIMGIGKKMVNKASRAVEKGTSLDQSLPRAVDMKDSEVLKTLDFYGEPFQQTVDRYGRILKDKTLLDKAIAIKLPDGPIEIAIPLSPDRIDGSFDRGFSEGDEAEVQAILDILSNKPGFDNLRVETKYGGYSILWGRQRDFVPGSGTVGTPAFEQLGDDLGYKRMEDQEAMPSKGTSLDQSLERMVATPNFKKKFRNSKIVDEQGKPKRVFHGTERAYSSPEKGLGKLDTHMGEEVEDNVFFFSAMPDDASGYAMLRADISKPGELSMRPDNYPGANVRPSFLRVENPLTLTMEERMDFGTLTKEKVAELESQGYDGMIISDAEYGGEMLEIAVFDADQIISSFDRTMLDKAGRISKIGGKSTSLDQSLQRVTKIGGKRNFRQDTNPLHDNVRPTWAKSVEEKARTPRTTEQIAFDKYKMDQVRKYGLNKFTALFNDFKSGKIGKTPFKDIQDSFNIFMGNVAKQNMSPKAYVKQLEALSKEYRPIIEADEALYDDSSAIVATANAEAQSDLQRKIAEGAENEFGKSGETAAVAFALDSNSSNTTVRLVGKRRNLAESQTNLLPNSPAFRPVTREVIGQSSQVFHNNILFPATQTAYKEMFGSTATDRSTYNAEGYVERLSVGDMTFYLNSPTSVSRMSKLSDAFGPMWAVQVEAAKIGQGNEAILAYVTEGHRYLMEIEAAKNNTTAQYKPFAAALHALYTFSSNPIKTVTGSKGVKYNIASEIQANALVDFFISKGVPSDGSDVLYSLLPNQQGRVENTAIYEQSSMEQELRGNRPQEDSEAMQLVEGAITAESLARELIRELGELLSANMSEGDMTKLIGGAGKLGIVSSQSGTVSRAINNMAPLDRGGLVGQIAAIGRLDAESTIGELLNAKIDKFENSQKDGAEATAFENTSGVSSAGVKKLLDALTSSQNPNINKYKYNNLVGNTKNPAQTLRDATELSNLLQYGMIKPTDGNIDELIAKTKQLEDLTVVNESIAQMQTGIDLNMSMESVSGDEAAAVVAAAISHADFSDQLFGVSGMRKIKAQIETMKLEKSYMAIFGMEPEYKMRDIIKNAIFGGKDGKNNQSRGIAGEYSLAMQFAASAMNTPNPTESLMAQATAMTDTILALNSKEKLTVTENATLAKYNEYLQTMDKATQIIDAEGELGQKINTWLKIDYKTMSHAFYDDVVAKSKFAGDRQEIYSPAVFVQEQIDETPDYMMSQITGRMLGKEYEDLTPHLKQGRVLKFDNFIVNALEAQNQSIEALSNQQMIQANLFDGFFSLTPKAGYSVMKPAGSKVYRFKVVVNGKTVASGEDFKTVRKFASEFKNAKVVGEYQDVYAPQEIADYFNKITATSPLRSNNFLMGLMSLNAKLKAIRINFGMFHRRGLLWSAIMAGELNPDYKDQKGFVNKMKSRFDYQSRREAGMEMMQEFSPEMMALNYYGMTLFQIQDIGKESQQNKTKVEKFISGHKRGQTIKIVGKGAKAFEAMTSRLQGELFGVFGSSLKTATAFNELVALQTKNQEQITKEKQESQRTQTLAKHAKAYNEVFNDASVKFEDYYSAKEEEIYRTVAGLANADFGGLHMGRMGVSKGTQDAMRLLLLGPDWTYSNIISALKAIPFKKASGNISGVGTNFAGTDMEKRVYQAFWGRIIGRSLLIATAINLLMAGIDDDSIAERLSKAKKRGKFNLLQADISPLIHLLGGEKETDHYLNTLGHFLDPAKMLADPVRMAYHKSSTVAKPVADLISGTRYDHKRPTRITKIGSQGLATWESGKRGPLAPAELPSYALWQAIQLLPIQGKNAFDLFAGEENVITGAMKTVMGLDVSRTYAR